MSGSWLTRVDPLVKLLGAVFCTGAVLFFDQPVSVAVFAAFALLLVVAAGGLKRLAIFAGALLWLASLGGIHLLIGGTPTQAFVTVGRVATLVAVGASLALTTDPADLLRSLSAVSLPASLRLGLHVTWRSVSVLRQELEAIRFAASVDGRSLSLIRPVELFRYGLLPLVFRMIGFADEMTLALQSRGISLETRRQSVRRRVLGLKEATFASLVLTTAVVAGGLSLWC